MAYFPSSHDVVIGSGCNLQHKKTKTRKLDKICETKTPMNWPRAVQDCDAQDRLSPLIAQRTIFLSLKPRDTITKLA